MNVACPSPVTAPRVAIVVALCCVALSTSRAADKVAPPAQWSEQDRISYSVGAQTGRALRSADGAEVNLAMMVQGLKDGLEGSKLRLSPKQMQELLQKFQQTLRQKSTAAHARAITDNLARADAFLAENKARTGVVALPGGLQYRIITSGQGPLPLPEDTVRVNYRGLLLDGTEFDATAPGKPVELRVSDLIAGWRDALQRMPVGSHWEIFVPPALAYGERGVGADIGANELLRFDVELLAIVTPKDEDAP